MRVKDDTTMVELRYGMTSCHWPCAWYAGGARGICGHGLESSNHWEESNMKTHPESE